MSSKNGSIQPFDDSQFGGMNFSSFKDANDHPINCLTGILQQGQDRFKVAVVWQKVD